MAVTVKDITDQIRILPEVSDVENKLESEIDKVMGGDIPAGVAESVRDEAIKLKSLNDEVIQYINENGVQFIDTSISVSQETVRNIKKVFLKKGSSIFVHLLEDSAEGELSLVLYSNEVEQGTYGLSYENQPLQIDVTEDIDEIALYSETSPRSVKIAFWVNAYIPDLSVGTSQLLSGAVTEEKISDRSITTDKILDGAITEEKLGNGSVTEEKIGDLAVTSAKIANESVTEEKISLDSVSTEKIKNAAVTEEKIEDGAVTEQKIAEDAITEEKISDGAVTSVKLASGAVTQTKILDKAIKQNHISDQAIGTDQIKDSAVTEEKIGAGAVGTGRIADSAITSAKLAGGSVTVSKILDKAVTTQKIQDKSITKDLVFPGHLIKSARTYLSDQDWNDLEINTIYGINNNTVFPEDLPSSSRYGYVVTINGAPANERSKSQICVRFNGSSVFNICARSTVYGESWSGWKVIYPIEGYVTEDQLNEDVLNLAETGVQYIDSVLPAEGGTYRDQKRVFIPAGSAYKVQLISKSDNVTYINFVPFSNGVQQTYKSLHLENVITSTAEADIDQIGLFHADSSDGKEVTCKIALWINNILIEPRSLSTEEMDNSLFEYINQIGVQFIEASVTTGATNTDIKRVFFPAGTTITVQLVEDSGSGLLNFVPYSKGVSQVYQDIHSGNPVQFKFTSDIDEIGLFTQSDRTVKIAFWKNETFIPDGSISLDKLEKGLSLNVLPTVKIMTLGDSITMLGTGDRGWIKYFQEVVPSTLVANVAMNSAVLTDYEDTVYDGNPQQSNQTNNVLGNQVQKILNSDYEAPDVIMIAIGTNGGLNNVTYESVDAVYYDSNNDLISLDSVDRTKTEGAFRYCTEKLHNKYPNALIFWCVPIPGYEKTRSALNSVRYEERLNILTTYANVEMITTNHCGINGVNEVQGGNGEYLIDGLHPNVNGAKHIGYYNAGKVLPFLHMASKLRSGE